jgi:hypothetical protein
VKHPDYPKGLLILNREGDAVGTTTGGARRCGLSGCRGVQVATRWSDGGLTYLCTRGLIAPSGVLTQIALAANYDGRTPDYQIG